MACIIQWCVLLPKRLCILAANKQNADTRSLRSPPRQSLGCTSSVSAWFEARCFISEIVVLYKATPGFAWHFSVATTDHTYMSAVCQLCLHFMLSKPRTFFCSACLLESRFPRAKRFFLHPYTLSVFPVTLCSATAQYAFLRCYLDMPCFLPSLCITFCTACCKVNLSAIFVRFSSSEYFVFPLACFRSGNAGPVLRLATTDFDYSDG